MLAKIGLILFIALVAAACSGGQATENADPPPDNRPATTTIVESLHVEELAGSSSNLGNTWTANVVVSLVDAAGDPVAGAIVTGIWEMDEPLAQSCETGETGRCDLISEPLRKKVKSTTLTIEAIGHSILVYKSADDHDPDPITDGTSIRVNKT